MSVRSAQSITKVFTTRRFDTGAATNGDSLPTGTLYVNGTADAASVTVTNITTGVYKAAVTLPTLAVGDVVDLRIAATVNSISDNATIWTDSKDVLLDSSGDVTYNNAAPPTAAAIATGIWQDTTAGDFTVALSVGKSLMNGVTLGTGLTINGYTGNTVQTGDSYARIGAAGAGLTNIVLPSGGLANVVTWTVGITGNITGNLSGSVGSVTGAVGSVTGNVGGSVASVTAGVTLASGAIVTGSFGTCVFPAGSFANVTAWTVNITGTVSGNATPANVTASTAAIEAYGDIHWPTATGFSVLVVSDLTAAVLVGTNATAAQVTTDHGAGSYVRNTEPDNTSAAAAAASAANIQTRLPAALTGAGNIKADALLLNGATPNNAITAPTVAQIDTQLSGTHGSGAWGGGGTVTIAPASSTVAAGAVGPATPIQTFKAATPSWVFAVVDSLGVAVNLQGKSVRFIAYKPTEPPSVVFTVENCPVSGASHNQVTVELTAANTADPESLAYALWNVTDFIPLGQSTLEIKDVPLS